jgi:uncharacterized membrane protein YsdA (DUF1294 family)
MMEWAIGYLVIVNMIGFGLMGIDKRRARRGAWRIKERTLFFVAIFGGVIGSLVGMYMFHHKTKHRSFVFGMPVILLLYVAIVLGVWSE